MTPGGMAVWLDQGVHLTHRKEQQPFQVHCMPEKQKLPSLAMDSAGPLST